ncbi:hypothetical protein V1511DRAFT_511949 [Dipodascopsis uninucleata]
MRNTRYATSRQKACQQCSNAKARCDRKAGRCTRCTQRGLSCVYPQAVRRDLTPKISVNDEERLYNSLPAADALFPCPESEPSTIDSLEGPNSTLTESMINTETVSTSRDDAISTSTVAVERVLFSRSPVPNSTKRMPDKPDALDFSDLKLICPIKADDITNRWLNPYIPVPGQTVKEYPASITSFIDRILKSYAAMSSRGQSIPPFVHHTQLIAQPVGSPLATCLSLVRICEQPLQGSEDSLATILQREMDNIIELHRDFDGMTLLSAFQAYLIYSMVLFFRLNQGCNRFLRQAMIHLQQLACSSSKQGLVCTADQKRTRPRWEEWIVTEAKRRTLFVMYLFDSALSTHENVPTFLGTELRGLPAPGSKSLWQAQSRSNWERAYNIYLVEWMEWSLTIDELWPIPKDLDVSEIAKRRRRVDQWLESVDEFGTMLYAIVCCTHGG